MKLLITLLIMGLLTTNESRAQVKSTHLSKNQWLNLTTQEYFDKSLHCQSSVKSFYWEQHQWPKDNPNPKPQFSEVFNLSDMKTIVENNLRKETLLHDIFDIEINNSQLQKELNRIVHNTGTPEKLMKIFQLFNNDPSSIVECVVRPTLVNQLIWENRNEITKEILTYHEFPASQFMIDTEFDLPLLTQKTTSNSSDLKQVNNSKFGGVTPEHRQSHTTIWTGNEMIIWGGRNDNAQYLNSGGRYNSTTDSWSSISTLDVPSARTGHTAIWTGQEMIIWGGSIAANSRTNTGAKYNPLTDTWQQTSLNNSPDSRGSHTAIWTGSQMIIWGGSVSNEDFNSGGIYDPVQNDWQSMPTLNAPGKRSFHTAVWTGTEMIVWGGSNSENFTFYNDGGRFNTSDSTWTALPMTNTLSRRISHTAIWTGTEMIIWGGFDDGFFNFNDGRKYNPDSDIWTDVSNSSAPSKRSSHSAVWTGSEMIIWGGQTDNLVTLTGSRYNPELDTWSATNNINAASARRRHTAVWGNSSMIIWGGISNGNDFVFDGSRYTPQTDSWLATENTNSYSAGGSISGLVGSITLQNNGQDDLTLNTNGEFAFSRQADGESYQVTVLTAPSMPNQTCEINNESGVLAGQNVTNIIIECTTDSYMIGGFTNGLALDNFVTLSMNEGEEFLVIKDNINFVFSNAIEDNTTYDITVQSQPTSPNQTCEINNGNGTILGDDIIDIEVNCNTNVYTVGGTIIGLLTNNSLVIQNNQSDDLVVSQSGPFAFNTPILDQQNYAVEIQNQPTEPDQNCKVLNANGSINGSPINNVVINCGPINDDIFENGFE